MECPAVGGKGSYHQWRYLTEETEGPAQSISLRISYAPTLPPFAAMPFLTGQVGRLQDVTQLPWHTKYIALLCLANPYRLASPP